nr:MAG TPA: hypothetical protein [Caudoviricetes sp.]
MSPLFFMPILKLHQIFTKKYLTTEKFYGII